MNGKGKLVLDVSKADKETHDGNGILFEWYNRDGYDYQMYVEDVAIKLMYHVATTNQPSREVNEIMPYIKITSCETKHG